MSRNIADINNFLQRKLRVEKVKKVSVKVAARWLEEANYLRDSLSSPGFPLRRLIKANLILGACKEDNYYWYIQQVKDYRELISIHELRELLGFKYINSVYKKIKIRAIPYFRLNNQRLVFYKDEIVSWLIKNNYHVEIEKLSNDKLQQTKEEIHQIKE